jgi:hypothetical protein
MRVPIRAGARGFTLAQTSTPPALAGGRRRGSGVRDQLRSARGAVATAVELSLVLAAALLSVVPDDALAELSVVVVLAAVLELSVLIGAAAVDCCGAWRSRSTPVVDRRSFSGLVACELVGAPTGLWTSAEGTPDPLSGVVDWA